LGRQVRVIGMLTNKRNELVGVDKFEAKRLALGIQIDLDRIGELERLRDSTGTQGDIERVDVRIKAKVHGMPKNIGCIAHYVILSAAKNLGALKRASGNAEILHSVQDDT
jgi:hypothetical protein